MDANKLVREIRAQLVELTRSRCIVRTHQEIIRRNAKLWQSPLHVFGRWAETVYVSSAGSSVRRLAGQSSDEGDVSLVGLIDFWVENAEGLWTHIEQCFPAEAAETRDAVASKKGSLSGGWEVEVARRILMSHRKRVISSAEEVNRFVNKRIAHAVPDSVVGAEYRDLDRAIDEIVAIAEKFTFLQCTIRADQGSLVSGEAEILTRLGKRTIDAEMKLGMPKGWESVFLLSWATKEVIALPLCDMKPPLKSSSD
jgi:hypothetical protein